MEFHAKAHPPSIAGVPDASKEADLPEDCIVSQGKLRNTSSFICFHNCQQQEGYSDLLYWTYVQLPRHPTEVLGYYTKNKQGVASRYIFSIR